MTPQTKGVREAIGLAAFEGAGIATIAVLGAEFMLAPAGGSLSSLQSLAPGLVAGLGAGLCRFSQYAPRAKPAELRRLGNPAPGEVLESLVRREPTGQSATRGQRPRPRVAHTDRRFGHSAR